MKKKGKTHPQNFGIVRLTRNGGLGARNYFFVNNNPKIMAIVTNFK
jgi:hypothetical protein